MILCVKNIIGDNFHPEDILVLKSRVKDSLKNGDQITLDFRDMSAIDASFFYTLLLDISCQNGRDFIEQNIQIENFNDMHEYNRFLYGA